MTLYASMGEGFMSSFTGPMMNTLLALNGFFIKYPNTPIVLRWIRYISLRGAVVVAETAGKQKTVEWSPVI